MCVWSVGAIRCDVLDAYALIAKLSIVSRRTG